MELEGYLVVVFEKGVNFPSGRPLLDLLRIPVKRNDSWTYGPFFALWAAQRSPYKTSADGYPVVFSNAAAIAEIYDKTPQQGLEIIRDRLQQSKGQLGVLGVSVPVALVTWGGPGILLALMAYLLSHLKHIMRIERLSPSKNKDGLAGAPWPALFPDLWSGLLTLLSLMVPSIAQAFVLRRALLLGLEWFGQLILLLATLALSVTMIKRLHTLRRRIHS